MRYDFGFPLLGRWSGHWSFLHFLALLISSNIYTVCIQCTLHSHCVHCGCSHCRHTWFGNPSTNSTCHFEVDAENLYVVDWKCTNIDSVSVHMHARGCSWSCSLTYALSHSTDEVCAAAPLVICILTSGRAIPSCLHNRGSGVGQFWDDGQKRLQSWSWEHALWYFPAGSHGEIDAKIYPCSWPNQ